MGKKDKKIDRITFQCTVKWKSDFLKVCQKVGLSYSAYIFVAIQEKIKRDGQGDLL